MGWQDDPIVGTRPKWESDPIVDAAPVVVAAAPAMPAIVLVAGAPVPQLLQPSANPYSAGFYPLGRKYTVGDEATFRETDILNGVEQRIYTQRVTRVDEEADRVEINGGEEIWNLDGNAFNWQRRPIDIPTQFMPAELQVGKKWSVAFKAPPATVGQGLVSVALDLKIARRQAVSVPAGEFETFLVEGKGWANIYRLEERFWLVPGLNFPVRRESTAIYRWFWIRTERHELVSLRQQAVGI